ncbi:MAG: SDR family NAD(P)-dependent oxidoreductase [Ktedonobacterales bacterium]
MSTPQPATGTRPIDKLLDLHGRVAIVTGGALGIGQAIAYRLTEAGAAVVIADMNLEAAEATAATITRAGGKALAIQTNVSSVVDAQAIVISTATTYGRLDYLVNNAGIFPFAPVLELAEQQWDRVLDVNLKGTFFFAQAVARQIVAEGHDGAIVNIASVDGLHPTGYLAHYDASKGGVIMLTKALAKELGPQHIRVNAIAPGSINTPGARAAISATPAASTEGQHEATDIFLQRIPLGRTGEPDDIATAALFLLSPAAGYITGSTLVVDGGYLVG